MSSHHCEVCGKRLDQKGRELVQVGGGFGYAHPECLRPKPATSEQLEAWLRKFAQTLGLTGEEDDRLTEAADALAAMREDTARLGRVIDFFASVIKSGEPWTDTCQTEFNNARRALGGER